MYIDKYNTFVYIEHKKYIKEDISDKIIDTVKNYGGFNTNGSEIWFIVTGFVIIENYLIAILPKGYVLNDDEDILLDDIRLLFSVLMKYTNESSLEPEEMILLGGGLGSVNSSIHAAYNLIEDYKLNGILKRDISIKTNYPSGNINWTSTINKKYPLFNRGYPIYHDGIYKKNIQDKNNMLFNLHKYAIWKSISLYGWLLGMNPKNYSKLQIKLPCKKNIALHILNNELHKTFVQREISVIKSIINILDESDYQESQKKVELLITKTFYYVWESICSNIFKNQYLRLKKLLPQPKWNISTSRGTQSISHRPDILLINNNYFYILDAKYYDSNRNLPGWHDSVKQFFYGLSIKKSLENNVITIEDNRLMRQVENIDSIENAFVIPSFNVESIKSIGYVSVPHIPDYGKINAYLINTRLAMKCYTGEKKYNFIDKLESLIS